jgi:hypothetical protein
MRPELRDVPSDVATNQTGAAGHRIIVILMDRTIPFGTPTATARERSPRLRSTPSGPGDVGALISTSGAVPQNSPLTARLLAAVNQPRLEHG